MGDAEIMAGLQQVRSDIYEIRRVVEKPEATRRWPCGHRTAIDMQDFADRADATFYGDDTSVAAAASPTCPVCAEIAEHKNHAAEADQALRNAEMQLAEATRREAAYLSQLTVRQSSDARVDRLIGVIEKFASRYVEDQ